MNLQDGWLQQARKTPSPNCDARPEGAQVEVIILHCISLPPGQYGQGHISAFFLNQLDTSAHEYFNSIDLLRVSSHFLIERTGKIIQYVSTEQRAWHAGESLCLGRARVNDFSIGIELEGWDEDSNGYTGQQYQQLRALIHCLKKCYPYIEANHIFAHSDIAPLRKNDPGPFFDWSQIPFI